MAFNGSGVFSRLFNWVTDKTNLVPVTASRMDSEMDGMATGLSSCLVKDGQQTATARIPFALGVSSMAGSVSSASYAQTNDANTGLYFPNTDEIGLTAGGTAVLTSTATTLTLPIAVSFSSTASFGSTLNVVGNFSVATNKFNVTAASGNTTIAGTLGVTGASTLAALAATTGTFSGAISATTIDGTNITGTGAISGATVAGSMVAAQAGMETGTSTTTVVTPGRQHFHVSAAKAWVIFATDGTISGGYNFSSVTKNSTGNWTAGFTNAFSSGNYAAAVTAFSGNNRNTVIVAQGTTSIQVASFDTAGSAADASFVSIIIFGDL